MSSLEAALILDEVSTSHDMHDVGDALKPGRWYHIHRTL